MKTLRDRAPSPLLLHCCCAPCTGGIVTTLADQGVSLTLHLYNPNIYPRSEYTLRKTELLRFAASRNLAVIDDDEPHYVWSECVAGLEDEPERGKRCERCFAMRLERSAKLAAARGFAAFATTLGVSRWKNINQVNAAGAAAAAGHRELQFWDCNWRKAGGCELTRAVARQECFYQQRYCGCEFSLRDRLAHDNTATGTRS